MNGINVCEHINIYGELFFSDKEKAIEDVKNYRAFYSEFEILCKECNVKKKIYRTHDD